MISAFSQEENRRNFFAGLGYTGSISLNKGAGNSIVTLYVLYFFKEKKYYALVYFVGSKFFQKEKVIPMLGLLALGLAAA